MVEMMSLTSTFSPPMVTLEMSRNMVSSLFATVNSSVQHWAVRNSHNLVYVDLLGSHLMGDRPHNALLLPIDDPCEIEM